VPKLLLHRKIQTPVGPMTVMASDDALSLLEFDDRPALPPEIEELEERYGYTIEPGRNAILDQIETELQAYFDGKLTQFETPLVLPGMPFQLDM
jgi:AraC family transcriptional regulator of adaptative response/methylated-DNA-[protein]-cysteine methyltransferase